MAGASATCGVSRILSEEIGHGVVSNCSKSGKTAWRESLGFLAALLLKLTFALAVADHVFVAVGSAALLLVSFLSIFLDTISQQLLSQP